MRGTAGIIGSSALLVAGLLMVGGGPATGASASGPAFLGGVASITSDVGGNCVVLATSRVDCWGPAQQGQLGFEKAPFSGRATPVHVRGVGGAGQLSGVASLTSDFNNVCALSESGGVDCWGSDGNGRLGDGHSGRSSIPVAVKGVGGAGQLSGVASLTSDLIGGYCALLTSGQVGCWGYGASGELGNGIFSGGGGSSIPVAVDGVGGTGTLSGVASLASDGQGLCALLSTGRVACWGDNQVGQLGSGKFRTTGHHGSAVPVNVKNPADSGGLSQVISLTGYQNGYCAELASTRVDCWGNGSALPVPVKGVGGAGQLSGVASLASGGTTVCALLNTGAVDCWGNDQYGQLGDGWFKNTTFPMHVKGVGGTGFLSGAASLTANTTNGSTFCALLTSGGVDCWGYGQYGELGNGTFYPSPHYGSAVPVAVDGVGGSGTLSGVASLASGGLSGAFNLENSTVCALLSTGGVDCWGYGRFGELGNDVYYTSPSFGSATPVQVHAPA